VGTVRLAEEEEQMTFKLLSLNVPQSVLKETAMMTPTVKALLF
jgi:hypothetical protein